MYLVFRSLFYLVPIQIGIFFKLLDCFLKYTQKLEIVEEMIDFLYAASEETR